MKLVYHQQIIYCTSTLWLMTSNFEVPLFAVHFLYNPEITLDYRMKHLQQFSPNGQFVHHLEVPQKIEQIYVHAKDYALYVIRSETIVNYQVFWSPPFNCTVAAPLSQDFEIGSVEYFGAVGWPVHIQNVLTKLCIFKTQSSILKIIQLFILSLHQIIHF